MLSQSHLPGIAAIAVLSVAAFAVQAAETFNNESVRGTWAFSGGLAVTHVGGVTTHLVGLGSVSFDGQGGCQVKSLVNQNGTVVGPLVSTHCSYQVQLDGFGSSTAYYSDPAAPPSATVAFVIADRGRELRFINTDALVGSFTAIRQ
jgi:hypothetical protein